MGGIESNTFKNDAWKEFTKKDIAEYLNDNKILIKSKNISFYYQFLSDKNYAYFYLEEFGDGFFLSENYRIWLGTEDGFEWLKTKAGEESLFVADAGGNNIYFYMGKKLVRKNYYCNINWVFLNKNGKRWLHTNEGKKWFLSDTLIHVLGIWARSHNNIGERKCSVVILDNFYDAINQLFNSDYIHNGNKIKYSKYVYLNSQHFNINLELYHRWISENNYFLEDTDFMISNNNGLDWICGTYGKKWCLSKKGFDWMLTKIGNVFLNSDCFNKFMNTMWEDLWNSEMRDSYFTLNDVCNWIAQKGCIYTNSCNITYNLFIDMTNFLYTHLGKKWVQSDHSRIFFTSKQGKSWLCGEKGREWLSTDDGQLWLTTPVGTNWLASENGFDFLINEAGLKYLDNNQAWLGTVDGKRFQRYIQGCAKDCKFMKTDFARKIYETGHEDFFFPPENMPMLQSNFPVGRIAEVSTQ
jgi:hypothetical protein